MSGNDFSAAVTLESVTNLSEEFLKAVHLKLMLNGQMSEMKAGLTATERESIRQSTNDLRASALHGVDKLQAGGDALTVLDQFNATAKVAALRIYGAYIASARRLMKEDEITGLVPDELKSDSSVTLLQGNGALNIAALVSHSMKTTLG